MMQHSGQLNNFLNELTKQQVSAVADFLAAPAGWPGIKHGDKIKLAENISVVFIDAKGSYDYKNVLEAHRKFYDLHYTVEGIDVIVSKPISMCSNIKAAYNDDGDYILFNEQPGETIDVPAGSFCLIPPADAHMALYGECGLVKKIVFKIPVQ